MTSRTFANSPGWKTSPAEADPEFAPLIVRPRCRNRGRHEQEDRGQAEDVLVAVERPVVRRKTTRSAKAARPDDDPEPLTQARDPGSIL
jgi:hypothetical protein